MTRCEDCGTRLGTVIIVKWTSGLVAPCKDGGVHKFSEVPKSLPKRPVKPLVRIDGKLYRMVPGTSFVLR